MGKLGRLLLLWMSFAAWALLILPVLALLWYGVTRVGWQSLPHSSIIQSAITLSLWTSFASIVVTVIFGTPLAYFLARYQFYGKRFVQVVVELPVVMPPAVAGLALLLTFGRQGILGEPLSFFGISIAFTPLAVILAQIFVSSPFYIRVAHVSFAEIPAELEDAARVDGASDWVVFFQVTMPIALRSLVSGLTLAWARAMGEFGATVLFAGNLQGRTQTMTLLVYDAFQRDLDAAIWTGLLLIGVALLALLLSQWLIRK